jgi:hypothetical protein
MRSLRVGLLCLALLFVGHAAQPAAAQSVAPNWYIYHLVATPEDPPALYVVLKQHTSNETFELGIWRSQNAGTTWNRLPARGLEGVDTPSAFAVDGQHPSTLYLTGSPVGSDQSQLYRSTNAGADWARVGLPSESQRGFTALAVDPLDQSTLYGGRSVNCFGSCGELVVSHDGGQTWQQFDRTRDTIQPRYRISSILIDPRGGETLWAETTYSYRVLTVVLLRGDRLGNWAPMPNPAALPGHQPAGLAYDPSSGELYTGSFRAGGLNPPTEDSRLWATSNPKAADPASILWDPVATWHTGLWNWSSPSMLVRPFAASGPGRQLYVRTVSGDTALWKSGDGGLNWQLIHLPGPTNMPRTDASNTWTAPTGYSVSGSWLQFLKTHGDTDNLGYPRTPVIADPMAGGQTVQYFQRLVLEWHPENPPAYQLQRRLLGDLLYPGAESPRAPTDTPPRPYVYFPFTPGQITGLGHFVANRTRTGEHIYFLDYFVSHGGVDAFGYPKEEPVRRNGMWTQRFQAAVFEYHPEFDRDGNLPGTSIPWRNFRVMLELLGDKYIQQNQLPYQ